MPPGAAEARALQLAVVAGLRHEKLIDDQLQQVLADCLADCQGDDEIGRALVREARRPVDRARRIPAALARALAAARSRAIAAWQRARSVNRFAIFRDDLSRLLDLKREEAAAVNPSSPYDGLLDEYEPGATAESLAALFEPLERSLSELVRDVASAHSRANSGAVRGHFPVDRQLALGREIAEAAGFDFERGRLDGSAHPFCMGIAPSDVRLTWRGDVNDFRPALLGILHEVGHGLYEQGLPDDWLGSPLAEPASLGVHESQSRLWENHIGRSREFWSWLMPRFRDVLSGSTIPGIEELWHALHAVTPSAIRVEADETTYNLHIVARFRMERALFRGELQVDDLPDAWSEQMRRLLGLEVQDDNHGVLQDIHWATGLFGYFPTYTLGNLMAAQLFEAVCVQIPDLRDQIARGEFAPLLTWLREKIHRRGTWLPPAELLERATAAPLSSEPFLRHVTSNCRSLYG